ncbi:CPBP family glutamic-type intramembrane protease [Kiritimatiellaeota bacterium B1221]|nr:CPBP family glutamic-type intramembrane protease [Kiritimatiellaeota bacterium B1221]
MKPVSEPLPLYWGLLPSIATLIGMWVLGEALLAVMIYHAGIFGCLLWKKFSLDEGGRGLNLPLFAGLGSICLLTWPMIHLLWPLMVLPGVELGELLMKWRISGGTVWVFVIYSVTIHPVLEESFWRGMMPDHWGSDVLFAGFHLIVLAFLVQIIWLPAVFSVLAAASFIWRQAVRKTGGLAVPILTHALADLGVILAVRGLLAG